VSADRIVTVSTVSGTHPDVERFVRRNLTTGVDHMLVFLDEEQPEVRQVLEEHPHVSVVRTEHGYWNHDRPMSLSDRHLVNANLTLTALTNVPSVGWLFQIDADEALAFDRDELLAIDARAVRFWTLEAAAKLRRHEPELFKKGPDVEELHALAELGVIAAPDLDSFFRGHHLGRVGVRPATDLRFRPHSVYELPDVPVETAEPPTMHLLRYESWCLDEFVARWQAFDPETGSDLPAHSRHVGTAFHTISNHPALGRRERRRCIAELFERHIADDIPVLKDFGLLVPAPIRRAEPRPLPELDGRRLRDALTELHAADKQRFTSRLVPASDVPTASR
jgi:hypothetical protein